MPTDNDRVAESQGAFLQGLFSEPFFSSIVSPSAGQKVVREAPAVLLPIIQEMRESGMVTVNGQSWTTDEDEQVCREYFAWATLCGTAQRKFTIEVRALQRKILM